MTIRPAEPRDHEPIWQMIREVAQAGETNAIPPHITRDEAIKMWVERMAKTYVAEVEGEVMGTYYLKPNHPQPANQQRSWRVLRKRSASAPSLTSK